MAISALDIMNGISLIIFCSISIFIGTRITLKYFKYKRRELLLVGLTWIFLTNPWYSATVSFIMFLLIGEILSPEAYFIIGTIFWPFALVFWIIAFTDLLYKEYQKIIVSIFIIYGVMFYVIFFYLLSIDPYLIGELKGYTDVQYNTFVVGYGLTLLVIMVITGYLFSYKLLKSDDPELTLKGKLLLMAFIFFIVGSALDTSIPLTFYTLPIVRGFEIFAALVFYLGFTLPDKVKKLFLKKSQIENPKS